MALHNLYEKLSQADMPETGGIFSAPQGKLFAWQEGFPSDGESGYAKGCILIRTANGAVYRNTGTVTSTVWEGIAGTILPIGGTLEWSVGNQTSDGTITIPDLNLEENSLSLAFCTDGNKLIFTTTAATALTLPETGVVVTRDSTDTLLNKTLTTAVIASLKDAGGHTHAVPNVANDTFCLIDATQTLVAKTLTSPTVNTANIAKSATLGVKDSDNSHSLYFVCASDLSANRNLSLTLDSDAAIGLTTPPGLTSARLVGYQAGAAAQGDVLFYNGTAWARLSTGAEGTVLMAHGAGQNPTFTSPSLGNLATGSTLNDSAGADAFLTITDQTVGKSTFVLPDAASASATFAFINFAQIWSANQKFGSTNLWIFDTNASHALNLKWNADMAADQTLNFVTGAANRTITLGGDIALGGTLTTLAAWTQTGAHTLGITTTGATTITLPESGTLATLAGAETLAGKILTAPKLATGGFIADANGNELLKAVATVADAVDEITITNAATGVHLVSLAATGGDTHISFNLISKGTGTVQANGVQVTDLSSAQTLTTKTFDVDSNTVSNVNATELDSITIAAANTYGIPYIIPVVNAGGATINITLPYKSRIIFAHAVATKACNGTWKLNDAAAGGGSDITTTVAYGVDKAVTVVAGIDDAKWEIAAGTISLVNSDATDTSVVFVKCLRID
jgi:hypothetical protein